MATPHLTAWHPVTRPHSLTPMRTRGHRFGLVFLVALNIVAAGIAVYGANAVLTNPGSIAPIPGQSANTTAESVESVTAFYAAMNDAIRTGDAAPLGALVAPQFTWCQPCPALAPDIDGLKRYVADLHRLSPEMRLVVDEIVSAQVETVVVRVHVSGYPVAGASSPWGPVDTLRLAYGQIVERRNSPGGATLAEPLAATRFDALPPAVTGVVLARLTFPIGAGSDGLLSAGPTMLVVESGSVLVRIVAEGQIMRAGEPVESAAGDAGAHRGARIKAMLGPGDVAIVPAGVRYALRHDGAEPAVVLGATLTVQVSDSDRTQTEPRERGAFAPVDSGSYASGSLPPAVQILLSERVDAWAPGPARIAIGRAILGPGARVFPPNGETLFVAVESGTLHLIGSEARTVAGGTGTMERPGPDRALQNAGSGLVVLLMLTVTPVVE